MEDALKTFEKAALISEEDVFAATVGAARAGVPLVTLGKACRAAGLPARVALGVARLYREALENA